jgi:hypothetical protein
MRMSLDRRLREEFEKQAAEIEPQTARHLTTIEARARRHRNQVNVTALSVAVLVLGMVVLLRSVANVPSTPAIGATPQPTTGSSAADSVPYGAIAGTYAVTLQSLDPTVQSTGVAGSWSMTLHATGVVDIQPPSGFRFGGTSPSGVAFSISGDRFRTNLFFNDLCNTIGTYTWHLAAGSLVLVAVDDTCSVRSTLLATKPWMRTP